MAKFDVKLGLKEEDGTRNTYEEFFPDGTIKTIIDWLSEKLSEVDKTIHDIFHLEIIEKED